MASLPAAVKILHQSQVSPLRGSVPESSSIPLNFFDLMWLHVDPVERIFFYPFPHPASHFLGAALPALKSSLSLALSRFYPLAGRIRRSSTDPTCYEIYYHDGDSVLFTLAEVDSAADFDDISGYHARDLSKILPLVPRLTKSADNKRLLALQVTLFPGQGFAVGIVVHHVACDGNGSMHFLKTWAALSAHGTPPSPLPLFDRSTVADPCGLYEIFLKRISGEYSPVPSVEDEERARAGLVCSTFTLRRDDIQSLKRLAASRAERSNSPFPCSTFVAAFAYAWVCHVRAGEHVSEGLAHAVFVADCRQMLDPPVPAACFGNFLAPCMLGVEAEALTREDGFAVAAEAIGRVVEEFKKEAMRGAEGWLERAGEIREKQPISVAGAVKFRVYEMDFGWGRPRKVEVPSIWRSGAMSVAESREEEGGVEIGVVLPKGALGRFGFHFNSGLRVSVGVTRDPLTVT